MGRVWDSLISSGCSSVYFVYGDPSGKLFSCGSQDGSTIIRKKRRLLTLSGKKIKQIAMGKKHTLFLMHDGSVFVSGTTVNSHLGEKEGDIVSRPREITVHSSKKVKQIACGVNFSVFVLEDGSLYTLGFTINDRVKSEREIAVSEIGAKVKFICCGFWHVAFLTEDGSLFTFGSNADGQLGVGHISDEINPKKVRVPTNEMVISVACGGVHTLFVTESGSVYGIGNEDGGRLGIGKGTNVMCIRPTILDYFEKQRIKITSISCGAHHTLCLTDEGDIYTFGQNFSGQLGTGDIDCRIRPVKLKILGSEKVRNISCTFSTSYFVTESEKLYGVGGNDYGQLGINDADAHAKPYLISDAVLSRLVEEPDPTEEIKRLEQELAVKVEDLKRLKAEKRVLEKEMEIQTKAKAEARLKIQADSLEGDAAENSYSFSGHIGKLMDSVESSEKDVRRVDESFQLSEDMDFFTLKSRYDEIKRKELDHKLNKLSKTMLRELIRDIHFLLVRMDMLDDLENLEYCFYVESDNGIPNSSFFRVLLGNMFKYFLTDRQLFLDFVYIAMEAKNLAFSDPEDITNIQMLETIAQLVTRGIVNEDNIDEILVGLGSKKLLEYTTVTPADDAEQLD